MDDLQISKADIFDWDVPIWSDAIELWDSCLPAPGKGIKALELAANKGGLSLYLADKGFDVVCSDVCDVIERSAPLYAKFKKRYTIQFETVDALAMQFQDGAFDVVIFKSFLGYLSDDKQQLAIAEIYRVLKPGGVLLFAENLKGSYLHYWTRQKFVSWGKEWNYITIKGGKKIMNPFSNFQYRSHGFLSLFFESRILKYLIYPIDKVLSNLLPDGMKYVLFGVARK